MLLLAAVFSMGPYLHNGRATTIGLPWAPFHHMPVMPA